MERKLKKSIKRIENLTRAIFLFSLLFYIGIPSLLGYLIFFSDSAKANIGSVDEVQGTSIQLDPDKKITSFNGLIEPYTETFGLNTVTIIDGLGSFTYLTPSDSVAMIIEENNIQFDANDIIIPDLNQIISANAVIQIIHIDIDTGTEIIDIPFKTIYQEDPIMPENQKSVIQKGVNGQMVRTYDLQYQNGELASKDLVSEVIKIEPIAEVISIGTMKIDTYSGQNSCAHWDSAIDSLTSDLKERAWLKYMIRCESRCNTYANNSNLYFGILQFTKQLFYNTFKGEDIFNGNEQIEYALSIYRSGLAPRKFPYCSARFTY